MYTSCVIGHVLSRKRTTTASRPQCEHRADGIHVPSGYLPGLRLQNWLFEENVQRRRNGFQNAGGSRSTAGRRTILCLEERMPFSDLDDSIILYIETFITSRKVIHVLNANDFLLLLFPISIFRGVKSPVPPSEGMHFFDWLPTT